MSFVKNMTDEYVAEKGAVTCEFSTSPDKIGEICREIFSVKEKLNDLNAYWRITVCNTCHKQHGGETYLHVEIVRG